MSRPLYKLWPKQPAGGSHLNQPTSQVKATPAKVLLISTYDLGRQPFGLASPAAWLANAGAQVSCLDLAVEPLDQQLAREADLIAFYLPMHTATRRALPIVQEVHALNPGAHLCFYGLYAPMNAELLRELGAHSIIGGEFEQPLLKLLERLQSKKDSGGELRSFEHTISLNRQRFRLPERSTLPPLHRYAQLQIPGESPRLVGYTEASRGCKHRCRHCPVVPVYNGRFRIVDRQVVLADIEQQVRMGARHITFGDADFFNGIGHAIPLVEELHDRFPLLTYDVTIKIEHMHQHRSHLETLRRTGCLFVTSAVESIDDRVLMLLEKGHTAAEFRQMARLCRTIGLGFQPTFVAFHPWLTLRDYVELLRTIAELDLIDQIAPVQLAIRLLIPQGSRLLELPEIQALIDPFDRTRLVYPWRHPDPAVDELQRRVQELVQRSGQAGLERRTIFAAVCELVEEFAGFSVDSAIRQAVPVLAAPRLTEPWYC